MDATERARQRARELARKRFVSTVGATDDDEIRLDIAALCIAAHAHPGLDIDASAGRIDEIAAACPTPTFDGLRDYLFDAQRFIGNVRDYGDPENSFLDSVLTRRVGIPITLSVLMMEVGRRVGVEIRGVGMPGHFLVQEAAKSDVWCDPFHAGALYDIEDCRRLFARLHGGRALQPAHLGHTSKLNILGRMLANLEQGRLGTDALQLAWMCDLHLALPGLADHERERLRVAVQTARARWN
jgi:regulator of sirC expression with transglutaminase-like and TPR domain